MEIEPILSQLLGEVLAPIVTSAVTDAIAKPQQNQVETTSKYLKPAVCSSAVSQPFMTTYTKATSNS